MHLIKLASKIPSSDKCTGWAQMPLIKLASKIPSRDKCTRWAFIPTRLCITPIDPSRVRKCHPICGIPPVTSELFPCNLNMRRYVIMYSFCEQRPIFLGIKQFHAMTNKVTVTARKIIITFRTVWPYILMKWWLRSWKIFYNYNALFGLSVFIFIILAAERYRNSNFSGRLCRAGFTNTSTLK